MKFEIITLFPSMFNSFLAESILKRARENKLIEINLYNLRDYTADPHRVVDDSPYGGGSGMVLKVAPLVKAIEMIKARDKAKTLVLFLTPQGEVFNQGKAQELSKFERLILVCGKYEGVDERFRELCVDQEISIGDYILNGGEIASLVLVEAIARLIPGVLGNEDSLKEDSFANGLLEYPHYTRPYDFRGAKVPEVLVSGNHEKIAQWRMTQSIKRTKEKRPDLFWKR